MGWDPTVVRVLFVLVSVISAAFPGVLVYLVLWLAMPPSDDSSSGSTLSR
jgi:phage shock protein PspC (stress-responsive transcriptional regulator)